MKIWVFFLALIVVVLPQWLFATEPLVFHRTIPNFRQLEFTIGDEGRIYKVTVIYQDFMGKSFRGKSHGPFVEQARDYVYSGFNEKYKSFYTAEEIAGWRASIPSFLNFSQRIIVQRMDKGGEIVAHLYMVVDGPEGLPIDKIQVLKEWSSTRRNLLLRGMSEIQEPQVTGLQVQFLEFRSSDDSAVSLVHLVATEIAWSQGELPLVKDLDNGLKHQFEQLGLTPRGYFKLYPTEVVVDCDFLAENFYRKMNFVPVYRATSPSRLIVMKADIGKFMDAVQGNHLLRRLREKIYASEIIIKDFHNSDFSYKYKFRDGKWHRDFEFWEFVDPLIPVIHPHEAPVFTFDGMSKLSRLPQTPSSCGSTFNRSAPSVWVQE